MKRIVLLLSKPNIDDVNEFERYVGEYGVKLSTDYKTVLLSYEESLIITDSVTIYNEITSQNKEALVVVYSEDEISKYPGARYFNIDLFDTDFDYFDKVFRRIHNLPWDILETKRLRVRETIEEDVWDFVRIYKEPEIYKYQEKLYDDPLEEQKYITEYREKVYSCQEFGIWTVIEKESGTIIGRAGLVTRSGFDNVEVGFTIEKKHQNKGYGTEVVGAILDYARENGLMPVHAFVMQGNKASIRLLEKLNFTRKQSVILGNTPYEEFEVIN